MRIALISTGQRDEEPAPTIAGRSLILRQLDFARACGAERIIAHGNGVLEDATLLSDAARKAGLNFSVIGSAHALVPLVGMEDSLLVLQPRVLAEAPDAIIALEAGSAVLAFPARDIPGKAFERIDAETYWAGALLIPGENVARLEELPEDADPPAALLRIALQEGVRRTVLDRRMIARGLWGRSLPGDDRRGLVSARLGRAGDAGRDQPRAPSRSLAAMALRYSADILLRRAFIPLVVLAIGLLALCGGPVLAWFDFDIAAFAAIAAGGFLLELAFGLRRIALPAFSPPVLPRRIRHLPDLVIFLTGILAIEGIWYHRVFPPLMLIVALFAIGRSNGWSGAVADRVLGASLVTLAAIGGWQEPALMAWAACTTIVALFSTPAAEGAPHAAASPATRGLRPKP